jgi:hypothetical protein
MAGQPRTTWCDPDSGRWIRRCCNCRKPKDLERQFYLAKPALLDVGTGISAYSYECSTCKCETVARIKTEALQDPARVESYRATNRAKTRRYRAKLYADPERHRRYLEGLRVAYRAKAEGEGRMPRRVRTAQRNPDELPKLPSAPLAAFVDELVRIERGKHDLVGVVGRGRHGLNGASVKAVCASLGIDERMLRAWRTGERTSVQFDVADRVLVASNASWEDIWSAGEYPEVHERLAA